MSPSVPTSAAVAMARPLLTRQSRWLPARASLLLTTRPAVRSLASCTRCGSHDACPSNNVPSAACPPPSLLVLGPSPMSNLLASTQPTLIAPAPPAESATAAATAARAPRPHASRRADAAAANDVLPAPVTGVADGIHVTRRQAAVQGVAETRVLGKLLFTRGHVHDAVGAGLLRARVAGHGAQRT
ncbi:hypothetical protein AMAG_14230 [Allomyces macrogynus ATCC 38327]|uniref:Uncharacterized protein n=1 Tax=Allomyces macrogynus (strain ATCC 38327) TaxID=578462 RepID=A0A0L0T562_ALLM3|nr:hypothetical protein AMAG_14230 [Allomyces macrogynus ATCC 38327]|eukprot:KNE69674.1 hypothetical protein AMAG_14230 [Allomyces macrogynus ATCC 38327]